MPPENPQSDSSSTIEPIEIAKIRMDGGTQPRSRLYEEVVAEYAEDMRNGAEFPAVTVYFDGQEYWLADGFHRVRAKEAIGAKGIDAEVFPGTIRDAVLHSLGANAAHGLRRTNADKRRAVEKLLRDREWQQWSNREIARRCGVSSNLVNGLRKSIDSTESTFKSNDEDEDFLSLSGDGSSSTRLVKKGDKTFTMETANIGKTAQKTPQKTRRKRAKKEIQLTPQPLIVQAKQVAQGEIWKLGEYHYLFCGDMSSKKFQEILPPEIQLFLIFLQTPESWPQEVPANAKNALSFYISYGENIDLSSLRQVVEHSLSITTESDDPVVVVNLPDPSLFILMENLYCPCYCAELDPQRCTDALSAWSVTGQPSARI